MNSLSPFGESLAALLHSIWRQEMRYLLSCGDFNEDGSFTIESKYAQELERKVNLSYEGLTDIEQEQMRKVTREFFRFG